MRARVKASSNKQQLQPQKYTREVPTVFAAELSLNVSQLRENTRRHPFRALDGGGRREGGREEGKGKRRRKGASREGARERGVGRENGPPYS